MQRKLLRVSHPTLYKLLIDELSNHHIHPFDIQATSQEINNEVEIQINFGVDYTQNVNQTFKQKDLDEKSVEFTNFCKEIGKACKEALIADYFKMVKP